MSKLKKNLKRNIIKNITISQTTRNFVVFLKRFVKNRTALLGIIIISSFIFCAIFASIIAPFDPLKIGVAAPFMPPNWKHLMGTSDMGKDVFSGFIFGARVSLIIGFLAAFTSTTIGIIIGATSGYYGGNVDFFLMKITELFQIVPQFFLAIVIVALFGSGIGKIIFVIGILSWPITARLVRSEFLSLREREFVDALRLITAGDIRIVFGEILPNVTAPIIVNTSLQVARAIIIEAGLSFLGLGDLSLVSWGTMLNEAQDVLRRAWWMAVFPGLGILLLTMGLNLLGDGLNDALNPKLKEKIQRRAV